MIFACRRNSLAFLQADAVGDALALQAFQPASITLNLLLSTITGTRAMSGSRR
jgi:hypothetical protein